MSVAVKKMTRTERKKAETRQRIMQAAYEIMSENGIDTTSIAHIANVADIGFGTFYNYFEDKNDLASQVLDCVITDLGRRNDCATENLKKVEPEAVQAISIRLTMREMLTNVMWHWWMRQPDLLVERMRLSFHPFGVRDLKIGIAAGRYNVQESDVETIWSQQMWMIVGGINSMLNHQIDGLNEKKLICTIMRAMGVMPERVQKLAEMELPTLPESEIDFSRKPLI